MNARIVDDTWHLQVYTEGMKREELRLKTRFVNWSVCEPNTHGHYNDDLFRATA